MTPLSAAIALRFVHLFSAATLFGLALFSVCFPHTTRLGAATLDRLWTTKVAAAFASGASAIALFFSTAASMAGSWSELDGGSLAAVLTGTVFGEVWIGRLIIAALAMVLAFSHRTTRVLPVALVAASAALVATMAGTGHAADGVGLLQALHIGADALHLLAAGAWLGGITSLLILLADVSVASSVEHIETATSISAGFAGLGSLAVATILLTGLVNGWLLVGTPRAMFVTTYGRVLSVKLALFSGMLLLAARNRFALVPALQQSRSREEMVGRFVLLRRHIGGEQLLGFAIILSVSFLGTLEPAINADPS